MDVNLFDIMRISEVQPIFPGRPSNHAHQLLDRKESSLDPVESERDDCVPAPGRELGLDALHKPDPLRRHLDADFGRLAVGNRHEIVQQDFSLEPLRLVFVLCEKEKEQNVNFTCSSGK